MDGRDHWSQLSYFPTIVPNKNPFNDYNIQIVNILIRGREGIIVSTMGILLSAHRLDEIMENIALLMLSGS
jgi:hypothetical protein